MIRLSCGCYAGKSMHKRYTKIAKRYNFYLSVNDIVPNDIVPNDIEILKNKNTEIYPTILADAPEHFTQMVLVNPYELQ